MQSDRSDSALNPVVQGDIALSICTHYFTLAIWKSGKVVNCSLAKKAIILYNCPNE